MKARLPMGVGGGQQNMQAMIKKAQKMQEEMEVKQAQLEQTEFTTAAGGGAVEVVMTGNKQVKALNIKPDVVDPEDIDMLQDLVISAINECLRTIETETNDSMEKITGGFNVPGMF